VSNPMTGRIVIIPFLQGKLAPDGTLIEPDIDAISSGRGNCFLAKRRIEPAFSTSGILFDGPSQHQAGTSSFKKVRISRRTSK